MAVSKTTSLALSALLAAAAALIPRAYAITPSTDGLMITLDGEVQIDAEGRSGGAKAVHLSDSNLILSANLADFLRASLKTSLEHYLWNHDYFQDQAFNWSDFIEQASITIRDVGGLPFAFIVGRQEISFGQNVQMMPIYQGNPLYAMQAQKGLMGFTLALKKDFLLQLADFVEFSAFNSNKKSWDIGKIDSYSFRVSKTVATDFRAEASGLQLADERRGSLGLIWDDGTAMVWGELLAFQNNPSYPESQLGFSGGASYQFGKSQVIIEFNWVQNAVKQYALGYKYSLNEHVIIGAEARINDDGISKDYSAGVRLDYLIGGNRLREPYILIDTGTHGTEGDR